MWHGVLLTARSGLVTAVILGTAHGIGETSPVLLTSGVTAVVNVNPFAGPMISLPLQVFDFVRSPEPNMVALGFGAAAVLILLLAIDKWRAEGVGLLFGGREGARARGGEHSESMSLVAEAPRLERAPFPGDRRLSPCRDIDFHHSGSHSCQSSFRPQN